MIYHQILKKKSQYELCISKPLISWVKGQLHKGHTSKHIYEVRKKNLDGPSNA